MKSLVEIFTARPRLSAADRRQARLEGRQLAKAATTPERAGVTAAQMAFAHRSPEHLGVAIIMRGSTRDELRQLRHGMRDGIESHLDYTLSSIARELRSLPSSDRHEAWRLFGQGFSL